MDARRGCRHHAPAADTRFGSRLAGAGSPCSRRRHAAVPAGRIPPRGPGGRVLSTAGRRRRTDRRPRLRHPPRAAQPRRTAPQRQQRLHGAHRRPATRRPLDPHGVLHHPRRPHRPHHRRNPDPQGPRRAGSAGHLRRRGFVAAEPRNIAPHARRGGPHAAFEPVRFRGSPRASRAATTAK